MAWAGSNPYAALSHAHPTVTQREEPKPKKNLANAKSAQKVHKDEPVPVAAAPVDPRLGQGNNSAKPNRPERAADRKGRTLPKHSGTGRGKAEDSTARQGKDWGEGRKRIEDGEAEAEGGEAAAAGAGGRGRGQRREGGDRRGARPEREPLTPEEEAALTAQRELEARQMTLEEYNAKKAKDAADATVAAELKEARRVETDASAKTIRSTNQVQVVDTFGPVKPAASEGAPKKKKEQKKKELLELGKPAPRARQQESSPGAGGKRDGGRREGRDGQNRGNGNKNNNNTNTNNNNNNNNTGTIIADADFPVLGKAKK